MKRIITLFVILFTTIAANAQQPTLTPAQERAHAATVRMNKVVALSEEQFTKVEAIMLAQFTAIESINADVTKNQEQKDAAIATEKTEKAKELQAVLTAEQWAKYQQMKEDKKKRKAASGQTE